MAKTIRATVTRDGKNFVAVVPQEGPYTVEVTCDGAPVDWLDLPQDSRPESIDPVTFARTASSRDAVGPLISAMIQKARLQLIRIKPSARPDCLEVK